MKSYLKGLAAALGMFLAANFVTAQVTVPNTFTPGTTISSSQVNANFATLTNALNRTGGTMTGTLTSQQITPSSTATYDLGTSLVKFRDLWLSRNASVGGTLGVTGNTTLSGTLAVTGDTTVSGNTTLSGTLTAGSGSVQLTDSTGKIQAISSTYFASLSGANLTGLNADNLASGTVPDARFPATLPAANGSNLTSLTAANVNATWSAFTPTWSGGSPSIGNGTLTGRYAQIGKVVHVGYYLQIGSTTNTGGADWQLTLPVTAANIDSVACSTFISDFGTTTYWVGGMLASTTKVEFWVGGARVGSTNPMTWATGDYFRISCTYEAA